MTDPRDTDKTVDTQDTPDVDAEVLEDLDADDDNSDDIQQIRGGCLPTYAH